MSTLDLFTKNFPELSPDQLNQLKNLGSLCEEWNSKINVISRKDVQHLHVRHILHSLAIAKVKAFRKGQHILDVGTGGGFPGLPLAILFPETHFHLVDSIGKKIKVVKSMANTLGLKNVIAEQIRAELLKGNYDFIVSRAVTRLPQFHQWVKPMIKQGSDHGILYLKGGDIEAELNETPMKNEIYPISNFFNDPFFDTKYVVHLYQ